MELFRGGSAPRLRGSLGGLRALLKVVCEPAAATAELAARLRGHGPPPQLLESSRGASCHHSISGLSPDLVATRRSRAARPADIPLAQRLRESHSRSALRAGRA